MGSEEKDKKVEKDPVVTQSSLPITTTNANTTKTKKDSNKKTVSYLILINDILIGSIQEFKMEEVYYSESSEKNVSIQIKRILSLEDTHQYILHSLKSLKLIKRITEKSVKQDVLIEIENPKILSYNLSLKAGETYAEIETISFTGNKLNCSLHSGNS